MRLLENKDHLPFYFRNAVGGSRVEIGIAIGIGEYGYTDFDPDPDPDSGHAAHPSKNLDVGSNSHSFRAGSNEIAVKPGDAELAVSSYNTLWKLRFEIKAKGVADYLQELALIIR